MTTLDIQPFDGRQATDAEIDEYSGLLSKFVLGVIGALFVWFVVARTIKIIRRKRGGDGENGNAGHSDTMILRRVR